MEEKIKKLHNSIMVKFLAHIDIENEGLTKELLSSKFSMTDACIMLVAKHIDESDEYVLNKYEYFIKHLKFSWNISDENVL